MSEYKKYFEKNEELLEKLEQLDKKKKELALLLNSKQLENPYVVEISGLPRTGKTESLNKVYDFFKYGAIKIEKADEPAFLIKNKLTLNEMKSMSGLEFNDKTLEVSKEGLLCSKIKNPSIILMDRGVIDNYFWYQKLYDNGEITKDIYINRLENLKSDLSLINQLFVMKADANTIIYRDYINQIYLEDRNKTTLTNVIKLEKGLDNLLPYINSIDESKVNLIDTTNINEVDTSCLIADSIMDGLIKKLK